VNKGNNKITEQRAIFQRERQSYQVAMNDCGLVQTQQFFSYIMAGTS